VIGEIVGGGDFQLLEDLARQAGQRCAQRIDQRIGLSVSTSS
jgi:hypothetical protein